MLAELCGLTASAISGPDMLPGPCVLIDAAPVKLEVDINIDVATRADKTRKLAEISPVAESLAHQQFDAIVKQVQVFVPESQRERLRAALSDDRLLYQSIETVNAQIV